MKSSFIFIFLLTCFFQKIEASEPPVVIVNIAPYEFLVKKIAEDSVQVSCLVPPDLNPHLYEPTVKDVAPLYQAVLWLTYGELFENKIKGTLKEKNALLDIVDLSHKISLLPLDSKACCAHHSQSENWDRHFWLSPQELHIQVDAIFEALCKVRPDYKAVYQERLDLLHNEIDLLDSRIENVMLSLDKHTIILSHPALTYFCRDYGLEQLSIESEGKEPRPKDIAAIIKKISSRPVLALFAQPQYSNKGINLIAEKINKPVYSFDPYAFDILQNLLTLTEKFNS
ncbi:MAG: metal ABC transporter solute-binding protein, Zn/Mn family [Rhabdochlamydiaceae bacterium]